MKETECLRRKYIIYPKQFFYVYDILICEFSVEEDKIISGHQYIIYICTTYNLVGYFDPGMTCRTYFLHLFCV